MRTVEARPVLDGQRVRWTLEQIERDNQSKVRIDWLRFTVPLDAVVQRERSLEAVTAGDVTVQSGFDVKTKRATLADPAYSAAHMVAIAAGRDLVAMLACGLTLGAVEDKGMDFYAVRVALLHNSAVVGYVMAGSKDARQASTVHFNLFGQAMLAIPRDRLEIVRSYVAHAKGWITRVDLAVDVWSGHRIEDVQTAWESGEFDVRGKRPGQQNAGSWAAHHSRTFSVGNRGTGKMLRAYEKGDEQFGSREASAQHGCAEWIRYEVEVRNNHRVIDLDVLTRPADFFAGAYAFCDRLLTELEVQAAAQTIKTNPEVKDVTALAAVERCASWTDGTCGAIVAALFMHGGDLLAHIVERNAHRVARRLKGFAAADIAAAFEKVAGRMAPVSAPLLNGAV
ncbi:replication initiation factor domain-containing protein [Roseateles sp. BYS78W]|uniref:Replication initiation factor domain-containing protein n=1 Tax=Pelomonas candidula TaxID=3299025 RepID=A0ABW7H5N5_9BURK